MGAAVVFGFASAFAAIASLMIFVNSKSAIHEILSAALGLVSAIFGVGCVVVYYLARLPDDLRKALSPAASPSLAPGPAADAPTTDAAPPPQGVRFKTREEYEAWKAKQTGG
jgi:hypothetical protein